MARRLFLLLLFLWCFYGSAIAATTTTTLTVSTTAPATGTNVVLTATLNPLTALGTVQFRDNGSNIGSPQNVVNGVATFTVTAITSGTHAYSAVYNGNSVAMHITQDGSTPTTSSPTYTSPISVGSSQTINSLATATGQNNSAIASAVYVIGSLPALQPTATPYTGTYLSPPTVTLSSQTANAVIWYTTGGSAPGPSGFTYTSPIQLTGTTTIKAVAATSYVTSLNAQNDARRISSGPGWKLCTNFVMTAAGYPNGSSACGGVGGTNPASIGIYVNQTPSLNTPADSIEYTQTITSGSGYIDSLFIHNSGGNDNATYITSEFDAYYVCNGAKDHREMDQFQFVGSTNPKLDFMYGLQCRGDSNGNWQIDNQGIGWRDVKVNGASVSCKTGSYAIACNQWHHMQIGGHRVIGDTSCDDTVDGVANFPCEYYDYIKIDGNLLNWNQVLPATILNSTWGTQAGPQWQWDTAAAGSSPSNPITSTMYLDNVNFRLTGPPSSITTATYTVLAADSTAVPPAVFSPLAGFYAGGQTVTLSNTGVFTGSTSNTINVSTSTTLTATTTTLSAQATAVLAKSTDVLSVTVLPVGSTGTVDIYDGGTKITTVTLSSSTAQYTTPPLIAGQHSYTAIYSGAATYQTSQTAAATVVTATPIATTIGITPSSSSITVGSNVTLTATLNQTGATGTLAWFEGATQLTTTTVSNGTGTFVVAAPSVGTHTYSVHYLGDNYYASANSSTTTVTVNAGKVNTTLALTGDHTSVVAGATVVLTATLTGGTTGTITFKDGATTIGSNSLSSGVATLTTPPLSTGTHIMSASYPGDSTHNPSNAPDFTITVTPSSNNTCFVLNNLNSTNGNFNCQ